MTKITRGLSAGWPYLLFGLFVVLYNYRYLALGFCPSLDEGYLQSLALRVLDGELPYRDFYFFRTPLSIYLQAGLIAALGDSYTILAARIACVVQTSATVVLASLLYRRYVRNAELLVLLLSSYVVMTLMLDFPWYSYDALFFAVLAVVLYRHRWFYLCGLAAAGSALCKQSYLLLLPIGVVLVAGTRFIDTRFRPGSLSDLVRIAAGYAIGAGVFILHLLLTGRFGAFFDNVFVLPAECADIILPDALIQNADKAFIVALPAVAAVLMLFYASRERWLLFAGSLVAAWLSIAPLTTDEFQFSYVVVFVNYTVALAVLLTVMSRRTGHDSPDCDLGGAGMVLAMVIAIQYVSGFNYSGLVFAHMGAGVALPLAYLGLRQCAGSALVRRAAMVVVIALAAAGLYQKAGHVYHEAKIEALTTEFDHPMLRGIKSTPANVEIFDAILSAVEQRTDDSDYIFTFPDHSSVYYLTGRRNPAPVQWFYPLEYNDDIMMEAVAALRRQPPRLMLLLDGPLPAPLAAFADSHYVQVEQHWKLRVLAPKAP